MQKQKLSRRERDRLRQRREILAAALKLFSEKGFHNVAMHEIAKEAEYAVGTLYKFFKNKKDLYQALIIENSDRFHEEISKAVEEADDEVEKLRSFVRVHNTVFRENIAVIRLYFAETREATFNIKAGLDKELRQRYEKFMHTLAAIFESGMEKNMFQKIGEPYHLAVALDSLCNSFLVLWMESPEQYPCPEDPDIILNILFRGLIAR
ncbi:MAG: TetR/AcrR family transcriptional regulator [Desulfobacterales bacterium]